MTSLLGAVFIDYQLLFFPSVAYSSLVDSLCCNNALYLIIKIYTADLYY